MRIVSVEEKDLLSCMINDSLKSYSDLVGRIYDCVAEPALWAQVLGDLTVRFEGVVTTMAVLDTENNEARFARAVGDQAIIKPLVTTYAPEMPFYSVIPRMELDVPVSMDTIYDMHGPGAQDVFLQSRIGREWFTPNRLADALCLALMKQSSRIGTLVITTSEDRPPITQGQLDDLGVIAPHIRRAVMIGDLFGARLNEGELYKEILGELASPIFAVSSDMRLLFANRSAEDLLRQGTQVSLQMNRICFKDAQAQLAITRAAALAERSEFALGSRAIGLPLDKNTRPAVAHVLPLQRRVEAGRISESVAAIFIAEAGVDPLPAIDALASLFGLTPAEKKVATHVASGLTRAEIAAMQGVSDGTIKSQLDSIFGKTETGNQRELQNLVRDLTPPVRAR